MTPPVPDPATASAPESRRAASEADGAAARPADGQLPHGWVTGPAGPVRNVPNAITVVRTLACAALAAPALVTSHVAFTVAAIAAYWVGDMADGIAARRLRQETRRGAVLDIACDRVCSVLCVLALVNLRPAMALPLAIFVAQFVILDGVLSLSFLRWPLLSPNYFHLVHRGVFLWNWSPVAKATNTAGLVLLAAFGPSPAYASAFALAVAAMKALSLRVVRRIPVASR